MDEVSWAERNFALYGAISRAVDCLAAAQEAALHYASTGARDEWLLNRLNQLDDYVRTAIRLANALAGSELPASMPINPAVVV
jgi:hypothetical protein